MKSIYVGNLSWGATEDSLKSMFEQYGTVQRAAIITDRETGQSRGFGFVEMPNEAEADRAIASLNGAMLNGRSMVVNEARPRPERSFGGSRTRAAGGQSYGW